MHHSWLVFMSHHRSDFLTLLFYPWQSLMCLFLNKRIRLFAINKTKPDTVTLTSWPRHLPLHQISYLHLGGGASCFGLMFTIETPWSYEFCVPLQGDLKNPPRFLDVQQFSHPCGCFLALRQCRWCGIMPDSNLLVHEGCELSAWVAFCMVAVPHVYAGNRPCCTHKNCWASWNQYRWSVAVSVYHDYRSSSLWTSLQCVAAAFEALQFNSAFNHFLFCSTCWLLGRCACSRNMSNNTLTNLLILGGRYHSPPEMLKLLEK